MGCGENGLTIKLTFYNVIAKISQKCLWIYKNEWETKNKWIYNREGDRD